MSTTTLDRRVDIKIGIDIACLALKRMVDRIVLITGDADFVPAAKLARREGIDVVLDPLWNPISPDLHEHIDGLKSVWKKPASSGKKTPPVVSKKKPMGAVVGSTGAAVDEQIVEVTDSNEV